MLFICVLVCLLFICIRLLLPLFVRRPEEAYSRFPTGVCEKNTPPVKCFQDNFQYIFVCTPLRHADGIGLEPDVRGRLVGELLLLDGTSMSVKS